MPPPLPFEVQEMILHELGHENIDNIDHDTLRTWARTLGCCSLVCKSWVSICQIHLMRVVDLESGKQLEKMASVLAAAECPLRSWPVKLRLSPLAGFQSSHHLVPYHLSTKLPSLEVLEYRGVFMAKGFQRSTVIAHPTFSMHLKQFRTITSLILREYRFQNFWDLRRFIVSLTSLSTLVINNTDWPSPSEELGRFPSLLHTASRLSEVRVERCTSINDILWCWITSCRPSTSGPPILPDNEFPIPHLTIKDGITIKKLVRLCMPGYVTCNWKRSYNSELNIWNLSVGVSGRELCLTIDPRRRAKVSKSNSSDSLEEKYIACIRSLSYTSSSEPTFDWTIFEENCSCLEDIGQVQINVNLPTVDQTFFNRISSSLPRLRARRDLSLTFVVNGKSVVRDVLGNGPHPDASNAE